MGNTVTTSCELFEVYKEISDCYIQFETNGDISAVNKMSIFARKHDLASAFLAIMKFKQSKCDHDKAITFQYASKHVDWLEEVCGLEEHETFPYSLYVLSMFLNWRAIQTSSVKLRARALNLVKRAATLQYPPALMSLGCYRITVAKEDHNQAIEQFKAAAAQGYVPAMVPLGLYYSGAQTGITPNPLRGTQLLQQAAEQGHIRGIEKYADVLYCGLETGVSKPVEALCWYKIGAKKGSSHCKMQIAKAYMLGLGVVQDRQKGMKWCRAATKHEDCNQAKVMLGKAITNGLGGFFESKHTAYKLFYSAYSLRADDKVRQRDDGYGITCYYLGKSHLEGAGCQKDEIKALMFFNQAINFGFDLELMKKDAFSLIRLAHLPGSSKLITFMLENETDHQSLVPLLNNHVAMCNFQAVRAELGYSMVTSSSSGLSMYPLELMIELDADTVNYNKSFASIYEFLRKQSKAEAMHDFGLLLAHGCCFASSLMFCFSFQFEDGKQLLKELRETFIEIGCKEVIVYRER